MHRDPSGVSRNGCLHGSARVTFDDPPRISGRCDLNPRAALPAGAPRELSATRRRSYNVLTREPPAANVRARASR